MLSYLKAAKAARIVALAALALLATVGGAAAQTVDEVLDANIAAIGGQAAIDAVKTLQRKGDVFVDGQFGVMEGKYERVSIMGQKAYNMRDLGVFIQSMGFDGEKGWKDDAMMGIVDLEGAELEQIRAELVLSPLVGLKAAGETSKLTLAADEVVDGVNYKVLEMAREGQAPIKFYVDAATNMLSRMQLDQDNPQFGPVTITVTYADYEDQGGVKMPKTEKVTIGEFIQLETTYTETTINGEVDETIFNKPQPPAPPAAPATESQAAPAPGMETEAAPAPAATEAAPAATEAAPAQ